MAALPAPVADEPRNAHPRPPARRQDRRELWSVGELRQHELEQLAVDGHEALPLVEAPRASVAFLGHDAKRPGALADRPALGVREEPVRDAALLVSRRHEQLVDDDRPLASVMAQRDVARRLGLLARDEDQILLEHLEWLGIQIDAMREATQADLFRQIEITES